MKVYDVMTPGVAKLFRSDPQVAHDILKAHRKFLAHDFGDMPEEDVAVNEEALKTGEGRLFGAYHLPHANDTKIWIIQDAVSGVEECARTILLPEEY